jgi:hypothetical protein
VFFVIFSLNIGKGTTLRNPMGVLKFLKNVIFTFIFYRVGFSLAFLTLRTRELNMEKFHFTILALSLFLQKGIQTLKSVNLVYLFFNFFFNFNHPLKFSVKSCQNFQNTQFFFIKKKKEKRKKWQKPYFS